MGSGTDTLSEISNLGEGICEGEEKRIYWMVELGTPDGPMHTQMKIASVSCKYTSGLNKNIWFFSYCFENHRHTDKVEKG